MKRSLIKRLERLEDRHAVVKSSSRPDAETLVKAFKDPQRRKWAVLHTAIAIAFALRVGGNARVEHDAADASLDPGRRAELTKRLEGARSIASALAKYSPRRETPPSARAIIPGSLDALLVELIAIPQSTVPPLCRPAGEHFRVAP